MPHSDLLPAAALVMAGALARKRRLTIAQLDQWSALADHVRTLRKRANRWSRSGATCIPADAAPLAAEPVITRVVCGLEIFCAEPETIVREKISRGTTEPGIVMNS